MTGAFSEFLKDYEMKEMDKVEKFRREVRSIEKFVRYPPLECFLGAKEPLAMATAGSPVWGVIPFYGSTFLGLAPVLSQGKFDQVFSRFGFTSRQVDKLIDFIKETGDFSSTSLLLLLSTANWGFLSLSFRN